MRRVTIAALAALAVPATALAGDAKLYDFEGGFDDATFAVENAIVGEGLVIDYVSHVGAMLERTKADVGSDKTIFANADIFLFCSASVSREVMEADPMNIVHCPYKVFVTEDEAGAVLVGYPTMPEGPMKTVEALLDKIAQEAVGE